MAYKVTVMNQAVGIVLETVVGDLTEIPDEISHMANAIEQATKPICPQCEGTGVCGKGNDVARCGRCAGKGRLGMKPIPKKDVNEITAKVTRTTELENSSGDMVVREDGIEVDRYRPEDDPKLGGKMQL